MDIVIVALLAVPFLWTILAPGAVWYIVSGMPSPDTDEQRALVPPAVRPAGVVGLCTVVAILIVMIALQWSDGKRTAACEQDVVPAVAQILQDRPDDLAAALAAEATSRGWTATTIADTSTTFRDGDETVVIVQHDPASSTPVTCW